MTTASPAIEPPYRAASARDAAPPRHPEAASAAGPHRPAAGGTAGPTRFAGELRRWRLNRRFSQLELAERAGTTQRHLSFMERGRSRPGRDIVLRLADSLRLTLRERNALLLAAGYAPQHPESALDGELLRPVREALDSILTGHLPYPAVVARPYGELIAANEAFDVLTEGAAPELLRPPVNVLRLALHPEGMARRVANLADWGRHIVENLRTRAEQRQDHRLDALADELAACLATARRRTGPGPTASRGAPPPEHLGFAVPLRLRSADGELRLLTTLTTFATAADVTVAELHLEAFLPADEATAAVLRARAARRDAGRRPPGAAAPGRWVGG